MPRARTAAALVLVVAAALIWAYTVRFSAMCRGACPGPDVIGADAYWLRDVRWGVVVVVAGLLVVLGAGDRRRGVPVVLGSVAWIGVDVGLDRASAVPSVVVLALVAAVPPVVAVLLIGRRPPVLRRWPTTAAATVCMTTAVAVAALHGPGDTDPGPAVVRTATVALLLAAGFAGVAAVAPARVRRLPVVAVLAPSAVVLIVVIDHLVALLAGAFLAVGAVTVLSRPWRGGRAAIAPLLWVLIGYPVLSFVMTLATMDAGRPVTALAGSPAVSPADSDMLYTVTAVTAGLALAAVDGLFRWARAELRHRPRTPVRPTAVV